MIVYPSYEFCNTASNIRHKSLHGCFILYNGRIISTGKNDPSRSSIGGQKCFSAHSEAVALYCLHIKNMHKRNLHLVVVRYHRNGQIADSKPCNHCLELIKSYNINKITYSMVINGVPQLVTERIRDMKEKSYISSGYRYMSRSDNG